MEQNELNSKLMQERATTQQFQQELMSFQVSPVGLTLKGQKQLKC